jgi:hypothetical protein
MLAKEVEFKNPLAGNDAMIKTEALRYPVNIRLVDVRHDWISVCEIARIFNEPTVIEHLSGIAPAKTERNIQKFQSNIANYIPEEVLDNISEEGLERIANNLVRATPSGIRTYFLKMGANAEVYVAEVNKKIAGTATLEKPSGAGKMLCTISKVAVPSKAPKVVESSRNGKGIARQLIQFLDKRIGDLGFAGIEVSVIKSVGGRQAPLELFLKEGFDIAGETPNVDLAWDIPSGKYVFRKVVKLQYLKKQNNI